MSAARSFKQRDVTRAIRAAQAAGIRPHVWVDRAGALHIAEDDGLTKAGPEPLPSGDPNPWDDLLSE